MMMLFNIADGFISLKLEAANNTSLLLFVNDKKIHKIIH